MDQFFKQLEHLFACIGITSDKDKKEHVLEYVDFNIEQLWKIFPEYADQTKTYKDFKTAIESHYPDPDSDHVYGPRDLEALIENHLRDGIQTTDDLQAFHLSYKAITAWLIEKDQIGE